MIQETIGTPTHRYPEGSHDMWFAFIVLMLSEPVRGPFATPGECNSWLEKALLSTANVLHAECRLVPAVDATNLSPVPNSSGEAIGTYTFRPR
jgi:hypothetical protein